LTQSDKQRGWLRFGLGTGIVLMLALFFYLSQTSLASVRENPDYQFDPSRVDLGPSHPDWLATSSLKRAFFSSYLRAAGPAFSLLDEEAIAAFEVRLKTSPGIERVVARPRLPHSMDLDLTLRRPTAATVDQGGRLWLLAEDGMPLPLRRDAEVLELEQDLAPLRLAHGALELPGAEREWSRDLCPFGLPLLFGGLALDVQVPARESGRRHPAEGAQIAALVQNQVLPLLRQRWPDLPPFLGVDISNGGLRLLMAQAEYRLVFLDPLGRPVYLSWGHSPTTPYAEILWQDKARNLKRLLEAWPGLKGIRWADLRWSQSWQGHLESRVPSQGAKDGRKTR